MNRLVFALVAVAGVPLMALVPTAPKAEEVYGFHVNMDPKENMVSIIMLQTPGGPTQRDFETAAWQAIVE